MASYGVVVGGNRRVTAGHRSAISRPSRAVIGYLTCPPDDCIVDNSAIAGLAVVNNANSIKKENR